MPFAKASNCTRRLSIPNHNKRTHTPPLVGIKNCTDNGMGDTHYSAITTLSAQVLKVNEKRSIRCKWSGPGAREIRNRNRGPNLVKIETVVVVVVSGLRTDIAFADFPITRRGGLFLSEKSSFPFSSEGCYFFGVRFSGP